MTEQSKVKVKKLIRFICFYLKKKNWISCYDDFEKILEISNQVSNSNQ